jgi:hypothetical protein
MGNGVFIPNKELGQLEASKRLADALIVIMEDGGFESYCQTRSDSNEYHIIKTDEGIYNKNTNFVNGIMEVAEIIRERNRRCND